MPDVPLVHFKPEKQEPESVILVRLVFNVHDIWFGLYWKRVMCDRCQRKHLNIWLTIIPCFPLHIIFGK